MKLDPATKLPPETHQGTEAWDRFRRAVKTVLGVPHAEIQKEIAEHRKEAARNPHKRGPKPKNTR